MFVLLLYIFPVMPDCFSPHTLSHSNDASHLLFLFQFTNPEVPGYVGFANLPNQVHRKSVKKGFEFTLMVVGKLYCYMYSRLYRYASVVYQRDYTQLKRL